MIEDIIEIADALFEEEYNGWFVSETALRRFVEIILKQDREQRQEALDHGLHP